MIPPGFTPEKKMIVPGFGDYHLFSGQGWWAGNHCAAAGKQLNKTCGLPPSNHTVKGSKSTEKGRKRTKIDRERVDNSQPSLVDSCRDTHRKCMSPYTMDQNSPATPHNPSENRRWTRIFVSPYLVAHRQPSSSVCSEFVQALWPIRGSVQLSCRGRDATPLDAQAILLQLTIQRNHPSEIRAIFDLARCQTIG